MVKNKWIFFDLGSTLIDESIGEEYFMDYCSNICKRYGVECSSLDVKNKMIYYRANYLPSIPSLWKDLAINNEMLIELKEHVHYYPDKEILFPDTKQTLEYLSSKYMLGVIANQPVGCDLRLKNYGIDKYFDLIVASDEIGLNKPDERIFKYALNLAHAKPNDCIMVGDRLDNDIRPAKLLGFKTIRVLKGFGVYQKILNDEYRADYEISNIIEITNIL